MIRGLLLLGYLLMRFVAKDLQLWSWKLAGLEGPKLRSRVAAFMRREGTRLVRRAGHLTGFSVDREPASAAAVTLPPVFVMVANHQSLLDIPALVASIPERTLKFVAKRSLGYGFPTVSKCLRYGGHALVKRPAGRVTRTEAARLSSELRRLGGLVKEGASPVIFPEGTRSRDGAVHRFHAGAVAAVLATADVPLVAIAVDGGHRLRGLPGIARIGRTHYRVRILSVEQPARSKPALQHQLAQMRVAIAGQLMLWRN